MNRKIKNIALIVMALVIAPLCFESPEIASGGELQRVTEPDENTLEQPAVEAAAAEEAGGESEVIEEPTNPHNDGDGKPDQQV